MNRIAKEPRAYRSRLRTEQAEATRGRILDAAVRAMAEGVATISVPAVARDAGVSVPTVYRHFPAKADLLTAIYPHLERRAGLGRLALPRSVDEIGATVRAMFDRVESFDDLARAASASPVAEEMRRLSLPGRMAIGRELLDTVRPPLAADVRDRIARLLVVLLTSSSLRTWRQLDTTPDEAAEDIQWIVRALISAAAAGTPR